MAVDEKDVAFVKDYLFYEMVDNRFFCPPGSREFVEFRKASAETYTLDYLVHKSEVAFFTSEVVVLFSGDAVKFNVIVKLLPIELYSGPNYNGFMNEETIFNRASRFIDSLQLIPRCYEADMGRNGRPVVVVDNPEKCGYKRILNRKFNVAETYLLIDQVSLLHTKSLKLKNHETEKFRQLQPFFQETLFDEEIKQDIENRIFGFLSKLKDLGNSDSYNLLMKYLGNSPYQTIKSVIGSDNEYGTICQGFLYYKNIWFHETDSKPDKVQALNWQHSRYGSAGIDLVWVLLQSEVPITDIITRYVENFQKDFNNFSLDEVRKQIQYGLLYIIVSLPLEDSRFYELLESYDKLCKTYLGSTS